MRGCIGITLGSSRPVGDQKKAASDCNHYQSLAVLHEACKLRMEG